MSREGQSGLSLNPPVVLQCGTSLVKGEDRSLEQVIKLLSLTSKATLLYLLCDNLPTALMLCHLVPD